MAETRMARRNWTHDELIVAFNLYCKTPFGKIHIGNPSIIELANALGRTPSAVSWKLANFARLDPALRNRNIAGAPHGANLEKQVWEEFNGNWDQLAFESEQLLASLSGRSEALREDFPEGKSRETVVRVRINQSFFRSAVLAAYDGRCCISGLRVTSLLNASHIIPWIADERNRTNPRNGLCLNALHDRAFDCGLMTILTDYRIKLSPKISRLKDKATKELFVQYDGVKISLPQRFQPDPAFLDYHNRTVFVSE